MVDQKETSQNFEEYEGFLDPQPDDVGDEPEIVINFLWKKKYVEKLAREHQVSTEEVIQVFNNEPKKLLAEKGDTPGENVYYALGRTDAGRCLLIIFILKINGQVMPTSAYDRPGKYEKRSQD